MGEPTGPAPERSGLGGRECALPAARRSPSDCLFAGMPSLAFAARSAARRAGEYAKLLSTTDKVVVARAGQILADDEPRVRAGVAGVHMAVYDVIGGLSGLGRYLLACGPEQMDLTTRILRHLVALTRTVD